MAELRELGYQDAVTSRSESRRMDDKGVDILYVDGYHIQCKRTEAQPNFENVLQGMPDDKFRVVFHKRNNKEDTATLLLKDFYKIMKQ